MKQTPTTEELISLLEKQEPLDPELVPYLSELGKNDFKMIRHPLFYQVPYFEQMNAMINAQFKVKKEYVEMVKAKRQFSLYVTLHEKPYRVQAFVEIMDELDDKLYWELLGEVYVGIENVWQNQDVLLKLFQSKRAGREWMMEAKDRTVLEKMVGSTYQDGALVYRGCTQKNKQGMSWTLDRSVATWFARRFSPKDPVLLAGEVSPKKILAYFGTRSEAEIVVDPKDVEILTQIPLTD